MIEIANLKREDYELELVKYLLENSKVLEKFSVGFAEDAPEDNLQKEILMFPRGFQDLQHWIHLNVCEMMLEGSLS